jgi:oligoendopeptidase F
MRTLRCRLLLVLLTVALGLPAVASAVERSEIPAKYLWKLTDLYPTEEAWQAAKEDIAKRMPELGRYQGRLGESAATFYEALAKLMDLQRDFTRLSTYASQLSDQDTRDSKHLAMNQAAEDLAVQLAAAASFVRPEILALGAEKVHGFEAAEPRLKEYRPFLDDILRWAPHTLNPPEEQIVARAGNLTSAGGSVHNIFTNADLPYPEVKLSTGETVRLDAQGYTLYRAVANREDREKVFKAFWGAYQEFRRTLGTTLYTEVKGHMFTKEVRKFDSCLESALFPDNIPTTVYKQLISDVHANLPTLHRYLRLRQRMMGVDTLRYSDLYAPIVKRVELKYTPEQAQDLVLKAVAPLGKDYVEVLRNGYQNGWVDWLPSTGKRSGAYSTGTYGVHPYQLQNFTGLYEEVSTLAHESGHSMHTYLADKAQPFVTHDYAIFVAEVASTLNENLLFHYMLDQTKDKDTRLFLLGSYLDGLRTTLFRQTMFAEFELKMHEMAEQGETLTGDALNELYLELLKEYYGDAQGVCRIDDLYAVEWAYIPHFYRDFYVYQYATSIVASTSVADGIRREAAAKKPSTKARDAYLAMLSEGSSKYPIDLLKDAGVDMTTSAPFQAAMREMNRVIDEIEKLLQ